MLIVFSFKNEKMVNPFVVRCREIEVGEFFKIRETKKKNVVIEINPDEALFHGFYANLEDILPRSLRKK